MGPPTGIRATVVDPDGRRKTYRPLPAAARAAALAAGLEAYERGEFFEAHEVLEPAWMGTDDPAERDLYQGLIKLAAAYVHAVRDNRLGWEKNLRGARKRLRRAAEATEGGGPAGERAGLDVAAIVGAIDGALADPRGLDTLPPIEIRRRR
jgi:predicted metal-dependent hydrolase